MYEQLQTRSRERTARVVVGVGRETRNREMARGRGTRVCFVLFLFVHRSTRAQGHFEKIVKTMRDSYDECTTRLYDEGFVDKIKTMDEIEKNLYDALTCMKIL